MVVALQGRQVHIKIYHVQEFCDPGDLADGRHDVLQVGGDVRREIASGGGPE